MVIIERKLWFKTALVIFDDEAALTLARDGSIARLTIVTRTKLDLPGLRFKEKPTTVIDLVPSEEDIFARMSYENRHKIRKSEADEELLFTSADPAFDDAYALYRDFQGSRGARPYPRSHFEKSLLFTARAGGEIISAVFVDGTKPLLRVRFIFSKRLAAADKQTYRRINIASRRLIWEICKWGKQNGYESLDLAGVNFSDPAKKGITEFKMSFGGSVETEYTYTRTSKLLAFVDRVTRSLRV